MILVGEIELLKDLEFVVGLPVLTFFGLALNAKMSQKTGFTPQKQRLALLFSLGLFVFCTITIVQDRRVLVDLWLSSPLLYSVVYAVSVLVVLGGIGFLIYSKLRPSLWRRN
jgi:uncharacterized membrane protein YcjF (UPF0283 family)